MRALRSLQGQIGGTPQILLVANGQNCDAALLEAVRGMPDVQLHREALGSLPNALRAGRDRVGTPYFAFLDDDDEYLPDALKVRIEALEQEPYAAVLASNGYRFDGRKDVLLSESEPGTDLLRSLRKGNWLASCGGLYRTALAEPTLFEPDFHYLEWTYIAYKLALRNQASYVHQPTFRIYETPDSLSRRESYQLGVLHALDRMLELPLPKDVKHHLSQRLGSAHHSCAEMWMAKGEHGKAWRHHLRSLLSSHGLRYATYTRKLLIRAPGS